MQEKFMKTRKIQVNINREDIDEGKWHNYYCPEALALRRTLRELGADFCEVRIFKDKKRYFSEIFYATPADEDGNVYNMKSDVHHLRKYKENEHIRQWSDRFDECIENASGGFYGFIKYVNNKFTGLDKSEIKPTSFFTAVPEFLFKQKYSKDLEFYLDFVLQSHDGPHFLQKTIYNVKSKKYVHDSIEEYSKVNDGNIFFDPLFPGWMARYEIPECTNKIGLIKNQRIVIQNKELKVSEQLIDMCDFSIKDDGFKKCIKRILKKYSDKDNFSMIVPIKSYYPEGFCAGCCFSYKE